ncbi:phosphatase PAP2 family protein [Nocardia stercoris]|nr:phosphatase PAP2 family protein [Nocardia stercoris]
MAVFVMLTDRVHDRDTRSVDDAVTAEAVEHRGPGWTHLFDTVSTAAVVPLATAMIVFGAVLSVRARSREPLVLVVVTGLGAATLSWAAKQAVGRPRPGGSIGIVAADGYSYPSMHTAVTAALVTVAAYLLTRQTQRGLAATAWWTIAGTLTALVAASRVYLGAHWATDVAAGWVLGTGWGFAVVTGDLLLPVVAARFRGRPASGR